MKTERLILNVFLLVLLPGGSLFAAPKKQKRKSRIPAPITSPEKHDVNRELQELLTLTRQAAEQAQQEARRARQQSEALQEKLTENTRELTALRQSVDDFKSQIADLRSGQENAAAEKTASAPASPGSLAPATPSATDVQAAQQTEDSPDSADRNPQSAVVEKIERLQEQVDVHSEQLKEHAQTKVESESKFRVRLSGMVLMNTFLNSNDSSVNDVPLWAPPPGTRTQRNNFGATLRQTKIGLTMDGPRLSEKLGSARLSAEAEFDFWGGRFADVLGLLRVVTASARLDWEKTSLIIGQRAPLVSPRSPTSIAAVWLPPLASAGNLWQWQPQMMIEHRARTGDFSEVTFQGGMMMPFGEMLQGVLIEGAPGYQSRVMYRQNLESDRAVELGVGGYFHRRPFSANRFVNSFAVTTDWNIPFGNRLELSGEAYYGRAIGIGKDAGGSNDNLYALTGALTDAATRIRGVRSSGGWAQLAVRARDNLDFNFAYGQDDPRNQDIFLGLRNITTRFKNQSASANFIWQLRQNFLMSVEMRRLWSDYATARQTSNHYNLAFGYTF